MSKTQPARGMRDFLPADIRKRNYVIGIIKEVYESYGFEPLETPAVENLETLTGKYGEEGGQLMYKILKRGEKLDASASENLADLALRYDLTVPLARVVANNKNELPKFFKRYQIQPVWRADRPARGRYREFYQCDVDAIGSNSMIVEAELVSAVSEILEKLGFKNFVIQLNHREILTAMLNSAGIPYEYHTDVLIVLDKMDKIGGEAAAKELDSKNVPKSPTSRFFDFIGKISGQKLDNSIGRADDEELRRENNNNVIQELLDFLSKHESGIQAVNNLKSIIDLTRNTSAFGKIEIVPRLARGLSYYTGAIMEIAIYDVDFTLSLGGGGRYDGLIGMFGKEQIPACGFSLGLERIIVVMEERGMFPAVLQNNSADVMVTIWNEDAIGESLKLANDLRAEGLRVLVYPEADKLGKQFKYAAQIGVSFVCVLGETELTENKVTLKNMKSGEQETIERERISEKIKL